MSKIYIIDWNSFIYRMFYAIPPFVTKKWEYVNAIYWIAKFLINLSKYDKPDYLYFVRDADWKTFRDEIYSEYKAKRDKTPSELRSQFAKVNQLVDKMWIPVIEVKWFEADDVIWTLATNLWKDPTNDIYILSWDKDLFSLVSENIKIYDTMKKKRYWPEETKEKFWIQPKDIITYLAIVWDKADNIPWIEWFWPKKAIECIEKYWSIKWLYENVEDFSWKTKEKLESSRENAFLSEKLATIVLDVDTTEIKPELHKFDIENVLNESSVEMMNNLEFFSLTLWEWKKAKTFSDIWIKTKIIDNKKDLRELFDKIKNEKEIAFDTETTSEKALEADLVWMSILIWQNEWYYINFMHEWNKIEYQDGKTFIEDLFDLDITLIAHNAKYDIEVLNKFLKKEQVILKKQWQSSLF